MKRVPLLRDKVRPRTMTRTIRETAKRLRQLEIAGAETTGADAGGSTDPAAVAAAMASGGGSSYVVADEFTAANQIIVGTGAGTATVLDVGQNSLVGRFGGSLDDLAIAASRIPARLAAGNLKACTPAELLTLLGAMDTKEANAAYVVKTAAYTATSSDFIFACDTNGGAWSLKMPAAPTDGQHFIAYDYRGTWATAGKNMTFDGNGKNINSFATRTVAIQWSIVNLYYSSAVGTWVAGRMAPI